MQIWKAQRPTWPPKLWKGIPVEPKQMCGAAAVCYCTCSMGVNRGRDTTPVFFTWRYPSQRQTDRYTLPFHYRRSNVPFTVFTSDPDRVHFVTVNRSLTSLHLCERSHLTVAFLRLKLSRQASRRIQSREHQRSTSKKKPTELWKKVTKAVLHFYINASNALTLVNV